MKTVVSPCFQLPLILSIYTYYTELKSMIRHNLTRFEQYLLHIFKINKNKQGYETVF